MATSVDNTNKRKEQLGFEATEEAQHDSKKVALEAKDRADYEEKELAKKILSEISLNGAAGKLLTKWLKNKDEKVAQWIKRLPDELKVVAEECFINEKEEGLGEREVVRLAVDLVRSRLREERMDLVGKLEVVEKAGDENKIKEISKRLVWLDKKERLVVGFLI